MKKINLGRIGSEDFNRNFKSLMYIFKLISAIDKNVKYKLIFYSQHVVSSGIKYRDEDVVGNKTLLELDQISYGIDYLDSVLIKKIDDNHEKIGDFIQKDFRRENAIGEYYEKAYYQGEPDYCESLDLDVFVDIISL